MMAVKCDQVRLTPTDDELPTGSTHIRTLHVLLITVWLNDITWTAVSNDSSSTDVPGLSGCDESRQVKIHEMSLWIPQLDI